jgi:ATP-dependent Clp protease protease subunit
LIKNLLILNTISSDPITLIINCPGGNVDDGWAIYDAIQSSKAPIIAQVLGQASSMGAIILQAAQVRQAYPFTRLMLHDGWVGAAGNARDVEANIEVSRLDRYRSYQIFAKRTGKPSSYWSRKMAKDYFLSADQALEEGLIDEIIGVRL